MIKNEFNAIQIFNKKVLVKKDNYGEVKVQFATDSQGRPLFRVDTFDENGLTLSTLDETLEQLKK